jgi:tRNA-binding EMAP/Myf-like protein
VLVVHTGAIVGRVLRVTDHPNGQRIWLACVDVGDGQPVQIVFGGEHKVQRDDLVPVAPPGIRAVVLDNLDGPRRRRKMRKRNYRGQPSHGMFCSLDELGWYIGGPNEVAILRDLPVGFKLDDLPPHRRAEHVSRPRCFRHLDTADTGIMEPPLGRAREQIGRSASHQVGRSVARI